MRHYMFKLVLHQIAILIINKNYRSHVRTDYNISKTRE